MRMLDSSPLVLLYVLLFGCVGYVQAGEVNLLTGNSNEVCEKYAENLRTVAKNPTGLLCDRGISTLFSGFAEPEWVALDALQNRDLIMDIQKKVFGLELSDEGLEAWDRNLQWEAGSGHIRLQKALVDIDNNGVKDSVIKYYAGICTQTRSYGIRIIVLNKDNHSIDATLSRHVLPDFGTSTNLFIYKEKAYFDVWHRDITKHGEFDGYLDVFVIDKRRPIVPEDQHISDRYSTTRLCRYEYWHTARRKGRQ